MSKRWVGLVLVLMFAILIAAATAFQDFQVDTTSAREQASADALNRTHQSAQVALASLRAAHLAYVSPGQGLDFWVKRAAELSSQLETATAELQTASISPDAKVHYDAAVSALGALNTIDQKVRDDIANGDRSLAAEVIFKDASTTSERLATALTAAQWAEAGEFSARQAATRRLRLGTTGAGIGALLLMVVVVAVRRRAAVHVEAPVEAVEAEPAFEPRQALAPIPAPRANLADAAQLCVDLARVLDGQDVPPLLKRAAGVLNARGLVLWVVDPAGAMLRPSLAHGYSEKVLQRLGPLQTNADNVTSLAFRSMQPQMLDGQANGGSSAVAVPLVTATGCIGVLSAEVSQGSSSAEAMSLAQIFAAQLSTLVSPADAAGGQQAAQA